jgi:hypothetical protein
MSHLPDIKLPTFKPGTPLRAADLNDGFTAVLNLLEIAMATALTPDPAAVGNEVAIAHHDQRIAALEGLVAMHARQRNEREVTPLAYTAAIMQQVRELREPMQDAQRQLLAAHAEIRGAHEDLGRRLARIEQQPEAASQEDHDALFKDHQRLMELERTLLAQVIGLRSEVMVLQKLATGHDRVANRMEFTPLAMGAHLLQRIMEIEKRLEGSMP